MDFPVDAGGVYRLSFDIPTGTQAEAIQFSFGSVLSQTFENYSFPLSDSITATAASDGSAPIRVELLSDANNNFGPYLSRVTLTKLENGEQPQVIPLPATAPLLLVGLGALAAARRRA